MTEKLSINKKSTMIREIQLVNLHSLKKLDEICRKYDISYWVAYGTLLGAVRHQGFIPWDDDLDVGMLREDYEKLCHVPKSEWGEECILVSGGDADIRHDKLFPRIYQKNTRIQSYKDVKNWRNIDDNSAWSTSLMCDIYLFDHVSDNDTRHKKLYKKTYAIASKKYKLSKLRYVSSGGSMWERLHGIVKRLYGEFLRTLHEKPWEYYWNLCERCIMRNGKGKRIGCYYSNDTYLYDYEDVFPLQFTKFEDMKVPIPKNYDQMLRDMYGDYMIYPPEDERYHINFIYADLGDGRKYVVDPIAGSLGDREQESC